MARPTLFTHRKFIRLAAYVGGRAVALGSLQLIWETAYASGDPFIGDAAIVESLADWRGEPGALAVALVTTGFLDVRDGGHYVHDLEDHAPDYVLKRWEKERKRQENGQTIRSLRQAAARKRWQDHAANDHANDELLQSNCNATVSPPAPAPAPAQKTPPAHAHDPGATEPLPQPALWPAGMWLRKFSVMWENRHQVTYGGGERTARACGHFSDSLAALPEPERIEAQRRAPEMLTAFFEDVSATRAKHPFPWFVDRFDALRSRAATAPPTARGSPARGQPSTATREAAARVLERRGELPR